MLMGLMGLMGLIGGRRESFSYTHISVDYSVSLILGLDMRCGEVFGGHCSIVMAVVHKFTSKLI